MQLHYSVAGKIESTKRGVQLFCSLIIYELNRDELVCSVSVFPLHFPSYDLCLRI